jgi:hypothetical protein
MSDNTALTSSTDGQNNNNPKADHLSFSYFTSDVVNNDQLIEKLTHLVKCLQKSPDIDNLKTEFEQFLLEMCWVVYYGRSNIDFKLDDMIQILEKTRSITYERNDNNEMVDDEQVEYTHHWPYYDASLVFLDVLSIFDCQYIVEKKNLEKLDKRNQQLSHLTVSLIQKLLKNNFITLNEMKIYLSNQSLGYNELFPPSFNDRKFVILKTRHLYVSVEKFV